MERFIISEGTNDGEWNIFYDGRAFCGGKEVCGNFNVIVARILGLSYPNYLRYCRDTFNATLRGKKGYPIPYWKNREDGIKLIKILNQEIKKFKFDEDKIKNREEKFLIGYNGTIETSFRTTKEM